MLELVKNLDQILLLVTASLGVILPACVYLLYGRIHRIIHKTFSKYYPRATSDKKLEVSTAQKQNEISVLFASQSGHAKELAERLCRHLDLSSSPVDISTVDPDEFLCRKEGVAFFLVSSYDGGEAPPAAVWFWSLLAETSHDFRTHRSLLRQLRFAIFGLGDSSYGENFNKAAKTLREHLLSLEANELVPMSLADEQLGMKEKFQSWMESVGKVLSGKPQNININNKPECTDQFGDVESESEEEKGKGDEEVEDIEDMAFPPKLLEKKSSELPEMLTPILRKSLTKQGYRLLGSHSGVKLCRWTKAMLRGRGGCYKYAFYGIQSHQCMETTPSLACANKCVFCWRHHSNPVGTEWKWKVDAPEVILEEALGKHRKMIKECRGIPGVRAERLAEGLCVRHCALSLVGEPIMYPHINRLLRLLHQRHISTFLVTNAQFPDAIRSLDPVTQLYVSVDAGTKEQLKKIDRPLFKDFWERFLESLTALSEKGQRTVYRLTLVKGWNAEKIEEYARLVELGRPDFVEVKGVTYCGQSTKSSLTMENVPWHEEVITFVQQLALRLPHYELASEHEHSNCLLIAHKKFKLDGRWHTWIDFDKFNRLMDEETRDFTSLDYVAPTPTWAVMGASQRGFDPQQLRWFRKSRKDISGC